MIFGIRDLCNTPKISGDMGLQQTQHGHTVLEPSRVSFLERRWRIIKCSTSSLSETGIQHELCHPTEKAGEIQ